MTAPRSAKKACSFRMSSWKVSELASDEFKFYQTLFIPSEARDLQFAGKMQVPRFARDDNS
jgi:hypothetical protein